MNHEMIANAVLLTVFVSFFLVWPAYAYIDPGAGSLIWQLLLAGGLAALFVVKKYWGRIKTFLGREPGDEGEVDGEKKRE